MKLTLVVRADLGLGRGKIAAQAAHAAVVSALANLGTPDFRACHGTRGGWKPCGWLTARQLDLSPPGQRVRLERTPRPGTRARPDPGPGHAS